MNRTIDRRRFIATAAMLTASSSLLKSQESRPNVLYILADEWRAQATGYAGDVNAHTPVLDGLARESINLSQTVSSLPVCCPHRASLMTGQYPLKHGVFINDVPLVPKGITLGEAFQRAGYHTGFIGKWHLYGSPDGHYGRRLSYIPPDKRYGFQYWKACECTHDYNHSLYYDGDDTVPKYWPGYDAIAQTADACRFIEQKRPDGRPFFLTLSLGPPHFPYATAPERYQAAYANRSISLRPNVPEAYRAEATSILRGYYAHIAALDDCLHQLLASLKGAGLAEDTIVIFTSDHGDMMRSQGLTTKLYPWEESLRVPFLLRYPRRLGIKARELDHPFNTPDIMPTLLSLCNIPIPSGVQGTDYSAALLGHPMPDAPKSSFINLPASFSEARRYGFAAYRGVRSRSHTYVRSTHAPWLLYDNRHDPYQMHNLCGQPAARNVQAEHEHFLQQWLAKLDDEFLPSEVYLERAGLKHYGEANTPIGHVTSPWGDWQSTLS
jgi:arylsulfatase A-like enzyme